ncbi:hypothetical protein [Denitromonas sp.]|uniref:hypothetical protein n=1 Tax=Denitromonas sp. TaxID=2734609 RepID=UPI003A836B1E
MSATTNTHETPRRQPNGSNLKRITLLVPSNIYDRLVSDAARERRTNSAQGSLTIERYYESLDANA